MGWDTPNPGTASAPITFDAQPGATITSRNADTADGIDLEPGDNYIVINGFTVNNASGTITRAGIRVTGSDHVTVTNNNVDSCGTWGIFTGFANNIDIENNVTSRSQTGHGIYVSNSSVNPIVRGNTVWGNYASGIQLNGDISQGGNGLITGALIADNIIYDNGVAGGSPWTFSASSGVAGNGSGFTAGNPNAPQGTQVAFLQMNGTMSQAVNFSAGSYTISFDAAQRANNGVSTQEFEVEVDGSVVGTFTPSGTSYASYTTNTFTVTAGMHTIEFIGLNPKGGDNTAFLDEASIQI